MRRTKDDLASRLTVTEFERGGRPRKEIPVEDYVALVMGSLLRFAERRNPEELHSAVAWKREFASYLTRKP